MAKKVLKTVHPLSVPVCMPVAQLLTQKQQRLRCICGRVCYRTILIYAGLMKALTGFFVTAV
jgi:hypothetical protein